MLPRIRIHVYMDDTYIYECIPISSCHKRNAVGGDDNITGDNACRWNLTALLNTTGLRKEDLMFVQFQPEVQATHHCVLLQTGLSV